MTLSPSNYASRYFDALDRISRGVATTDLTQAPIAFDDAISRFTKIVTDAKTGRGKLMFVGNGGSASIASHMAIDFFKNGGTDALAFNDPMFLTCLSNDLGYENVFSFQVERFASKGDVLIAISSSGRSPNILNSVAAARKRGATVVTLSGFRDDNPLRRLGDLNLYVPSGEYGYVELIHCSLCHCVLDGLMNIPTD